MESSAADPYEKRNLASEDPDLVNNMTARLLSFWMLPPDNLPNTEFTGVDSEGVWTTDWCELDPFASINPYVVYASFGAIILLIGSVLAICKCKSCKNPDGYSKM